MKSRKVFRFSPEFDDETVRIRSSNH